MSFTNSLMVGRYRLTIGCADTLGGRVLDEGLSPRPRPRYRDQFTREAWRTSGVSQRVLATPQRVPYRETRRECGV